VCIPLDKEFLKWAGWFLGYDSPIYVIAQDGAEALQARRELALIGLDDVRGWVSHGLFRATEMASVPSCGFQEALSPGTALLDVRSTNEYVEGHVPGSIHVPLGYLLDSLDALPRESKIAVHCATGSRSQLASILLRGRGFCGVCNVSGGFDAYNSGGLPVEVGGGRPERVT
jgi:hydroxyacylglutathione hydrolase